MLRRAFALTLVLTACGGDEDDAPAKPAATTAAPAAPSAPGAAPGGVAGGKQLSPMLQVEDRVTSCDPPPPTKKCDPKLVTSCRSDGASGREYCLETTKGWFCGPCTEKATIRQTLQTRDFVADVTRDPFQPLGAFQPSTAADLTSALPRDVTQRCSRPGQVLRPDVSYFDLTMLGIIKIGLQRKILMAGPDNVGFTVKSNECVGREKVWVKEFGEHAQKGPFVIFEIPSDPTGPQRPPEERTMHLYPDAAVSMNWRQYTTVPSDPTVPVVAPPSSSGPPPAERPRPNVQIQIPGPPVQQVPPPPSAPSTSVNP